MWTRRDRLGIAAVTLLGLSLAQCASPSPPASARPSSSPLPESYDAEVGVYRDAGGGLIAVNGFGDITHLPDGFTRHLYPTSVPDRYTFGPGYMLALPKESDVVFQVSGGRAGSLTETPMRGAPVTATRAPLTETQARIQADGAVLAATITSPATPGPHPGIVVVHGSEPGVRADYTFWVALYTSLGYTVLTYDKRGCGDSTGRFPGDVVTEQELDMFADDAAAALAYLARQPGVDGRRTGYHGGSQGGWTVPLAIHRHPGATFAILVSGPAVSQGTQSAWADLTSGHPGAPLPYPSDPALIRADSGYDPAATLAGIGTPILWINGAADRAVPTRLNLLILLGLHNAHFQEQILVTADHGMLEDPSGDGEARATRLVPALFTTISEWLRAR